jgi:teichuronic acid biosynthesis glycosyltransferase TuaG
MEQTKTDEAHVEVVIPTYQETRRTARAIQSVLAQGIHVSRVQVLDDGSEEDIVDELRRELSIFDCIEFHSLEHSGHPGIVRRTGVQNSRADWIAFLDADDYWDREKITRQLELANRIGAGMVYSNAWLDRGGSKVAYFSPSNKLPRKLTTFRLLISNYVINSSVLVRREHLLAVGGYADSPGVRAVEDYATWLRLSTICEIAGIQEPLLTYSASESSFSRVNSGVSPLVAIRDFRVWVARSNMPFIKRTKNVLLASLMIWYHVLREYVSNRLAALKAKTW